MANIFDLFRQISGEQDTASSHQINFLVVGLGNPGVQYANTRHNAGFLALDFVADKCGVRIDRSRFKALVGEGKIGSAHVLFLKPQTFMNLSGEAVGEAARYYKIPAEHIIVLSDDVTLDVGRLRVRRKGSAGGHNGLKSIEEHLSSSEYPRMKIGVGQKPHPDYDLADWVLGTFGAEDKKKLTQSFDLLYWGLEKLIDGDVEMAMQICNGK